MALTTRISMGIDAELTKALDLSTPEDHMILNSVYAWPTGTGAGQADLLWHDQRTLAASATEDLDLAAVLSDAFGTVLTFARIKMIIVKAAVANTNNVNVTRPAANGVPIFLAAGDGVPVLPGGAYWWIAPTATAIAVTAGTGDLLTITNSAAGTSVTYDIVLIGASV